MRGPSLNIFAGIPKHYITSDLVEHLEISKVEEYFHVGAIPKPGPTLTNFLHGIKLTH